MIPFVRDHEIEYGRRYQVSDLIQRVVANNPGPFTYTGTGTYILGRNEPCAEVAVIDPGPPDPKHLEALIEAIADRRVTRILVTHTHRDHSPLSHPLADQTGAEILAARPPAVVTHASGPLDEDEDENFQPDVILKGGEVIRGDGWTIEAVATPGHASNHLSFALAEENALFTGDHVMGWSTTVVAPPDGDMVDYMNSLQTVAARNFSTLYPTHGAPITDPRPFLAAYRDHRLAREAQVIERLGAGDRTIAEMIPLLYAAVDQRLWPAASLSVLAHLGKLVRDGRVRAEPEASLAAEWRLIG